MFSRNSHCLAVLVVCLIACTAPPIASGGEMRTWTAASGGFTIEAELITLKPGDVAQLKTKDGRTIDVPLAQLSAADQAYARKPAAAPAATSATSGAASSASASVKFNQVQKQADRCRTPDEALILFKVFHDDTATSAADKELALAKIGEYKQLSADKKVRLNKQWVSADEAAAVRKKADELMRQGLELWKLDQEESGRRKFTEAAALEPEEIRAEFVLAFMYTLQRSAEKALPIFQRCLQRDPDNIAVLNNIALLSASRGDWVTMMSYWRKALQQQPDQRVVHNVGRFLQQATAANLPIPKAPREALAVPYTELVASGKYKATNPEVGWLFLLLEESDLDFSLKKDDETKTEKKVAVPEANDDGVVVGGGTGFVVHPGYVMTNAHVAVDDAVFEIQTQDGKRYRGSRVSKATTADLALIQCEELAAPPLVLSNSITPRGTDVMVLGFPEFYALGATLKATRGSISSVPDPKVEEIYLYDAVTNSGNSGGPVCDAAGNVVAVHFASMNTASRYGCGVPATTARAFLTQTIPQLSPQQAPPNTEKLEWPAVDAKVSPSTVLVWVRKKNAAPTKPSVGSDVLELPLCLFCGGNKGLRCVAPGCAKMRAANRGRSNCGNCKGSGLVKCEVCDGLGVDAQLASVQAAVKKVIAANGGSTASTSTTTARPATSSTASTTTSAAGLSSEDAKISTPMLQAMRKNAKAGDPNSLADGSVYQSLGVDPGLFEKPSITLSDLEMPQILASLRSPDPVKASDAAKQLGSSIPLPDYQQQVAMALESRIVNAPPAYRLKSLACRALVIWGRPQSKLAVQMNLRSESWVVRKQAAISIAHANDTSGIPKLVECLLRPDDFQGDHSAGQFSVNGDRGFFLRALIVMGEASVPELERVRPTQNAKVQEMIDFIIAACKET